MGFRMFSHAVFWGAMTLLFSMVTLTRGLPSGFIAEVLSDDTNAIGGIFAPNPKNGNPLLILVSKNGVVRAMEDPDKSDSKFQIILDLGGDICQNGERGLQQAVIHPDFKNNRFIYLFYTKLVEGCLEDLNQDKELHPYNVIARFTMDEETLMLDYDSREEIWRGPFLGYSLHNGGAMLFGNDDKLYVTHGEAGVQENAQNLKNVAGTLIRLNDDGSTPDDNPFTKKNGYDGFECRDTEGSVPANNTKANPVCSEIFAYGFRNPFRVSLDPNEKDKTLFSIQDVGGRTWEELSYGGTDYIGMNYGWKPYEGPCKRHSADDCPVPKDMVDPFHYYIHRSDKSGCVSGAAFVPEGVWPEEYSFMFADFVFYEVYSLSDDPDGGCRSCSPPVSKFKNETFFAPQRYPGDSKNTGRILDVFFGPYEDTQALYVILYGKKSYRIRYTGIHNDPPLAKFSASKLHVDVGEEIQFDGSESYDPEGLEITYKWFFGDDDNTKSTETNPTHTYDKPGNYEVKLFVEDAVNQVQQRSITIMVGDPPNAEILSPVEGDEFYVGQVLRLEGKAIYLNGTEFDDSQLQWEVRKHHDDHYHPFLAPTYGNKIDLSPAPEPEDFYASTNSYLEIILYATDDNGLTRKISRFVQPSLVEVVIDSNLAGSKIEVNSEEVPASSIIVSWKDQQLNLKAKSDSTYQFVSWSDGFEEQSRSVVVDYTDPIVSANYCALIGSKCSDQIQCCSGYCVRDETSISPIRGSAIQKSANSSVIEMFCSEEPFTTSAPTGTPSAIETEDPFSVDFNFSESEDTMPPSDFDEDATTASPLAETESAAMEVKYTSLFLFSVSVAITALTTM